MRTDTAVYPCRKALREGDYAALRGGTRRRARRNGWNDGMVLCATCAERIPRKPHEKQRDGILGSAVVSYCGSRG